MKKLGTLALAAALTASLALPAFAAEGDAPLLIAPNPISEGLPEETAVPYRPGAPYAATLMLNGETVDASSVPNAPGIPLRLLAESDHGSAYWDEESGVGTGYLDGYRVSVDVNTLAISVNDEPLEGVTAVVKDGFCFVPAEVIDGLEGYSVNTNPELDVSRCDITTPNGAPLTKLAYDIIDTVGMASSVKNSLQDMKEYHGMDTDNYDEIAGFTSMSVRSDTLYIGKVTEGGSMDRAKEEFEARRAGVQQSFEQYLPGPLELAKNGKIVENGDYVMLVISEDNDKAIEMFNAYVAAQTDANA